MSIQRYDILHDPSQLNHYLRAPNADGFWVMYSDHAALLAAKDEEIVRLRKFEDVVCGYAEAATKAAKNAGDRGHYLIAHECEIGSRAYIAILLSFREYLTLKESPHA